MGPPPLNLCRPASGGQKSTHPALAWQGFCPEVVHITATHLSLAKAGHLASGASLPGAQKCLLSCAREEGEQSKEHPLKKGVLLCCFLTLQAVCQPVLRRTAPERPVRTSLDLELDLQASLTRQSRLNDELQALRGLRQKLEELKAQGETDLPPGVMEDERFQKLLKQAEKQVQISVSPLVPEGSAKSGSKSRPGVGFPSLDLGLTKSSGPFPGTQNTFFPLS